MLDTDYTQCLSHAPLRAFNLLRPKRLSGGDLADVENLERSILRFGLLSPITVIKRGVSLIVVDGRKRLAAIRRLSFQGRLPRSLSHIPYRLAHSAKAGQHAASLLLNNEDLYQALCETYDAGYSVEETAQNFFVSRQCVRDALTLKRLSVIIREAFFTRLINFAQAKAYATIPDKAEQMARFRHYGPFASAETIQSSNMTKNVCDQPALSLAAA